MLGNYRRILTPVDESQQADHMFKKAIAIAKRNEAEIFLVHVTDTRYESLSPEHSLVDYTDFDTTFLVEKEKLGQEAEVTIRTFIVQGNPKEIIAQQFPKEQQIDLIVIGATGKGAINRALVGSVSSYVIKHATTDVLVVR